MLVIAITNTGLIKAIEMSRIITIVGNLPSVCTRATETTSFST